MRLTAQAYLVQGGAEAIDDVLALLDEDGGLPSGRQGNPDVYARSYPVFLMDDARELRERANLRAVGSEGRTFVIAAPSIPVDAQNTLLKTFEEPPAGARFVLIVPAPEMLLPTLRSRVQMLALDAKSAASPVDATKFLASAPVKRLEMLKPLLDKDDDDRRDVAGALSFLASIERALSAKPQAHREGIKAVYRARKYINDRGAIVKSLLEQMAFLIPGK